MIFTMWWQLIGLLIFIIAVSLCTVYLTRKQKIEVVVVYKTPEDVAFDRLVKLEQYYHHFNVAERFVLTFKEFVEKVDNGTWKELVSHGPIFGASYNGSPEKTK